MLRYFLAIWSGAPGRTSRIVHHSLFSLSENGIAMTTNPPSRTDLILRYYREIAAPTAIAVQLFLWRVAIFVVVVKILLACAQD